MINYRVSIYFINFFRFCSCGYMYETSFILTRNTATTCPTRYSYSSILLSLNIFYYTFSYTFTSQHI